MAVKGKPKIKLKKIQNDMTSLGIAVPHQIHLKMFVEGSFLKRGGSFYIRNHAATR